MPGIGGSFGSSATICSTTPVFGPPLCSCPVECRKRGPKPTVVATLCRVANLQAQLVEQSRVRSALRAMYAVIAT